MTHHLRPSLLILLSLCLLGAVLAPVTAEETTPARPGSVILYIGDGMGLAQVTAARIYKGNARDGLLALDRFPRVALVRTYAADQMVTDSAASATAMATGFKTNNGMIALAPDNRRLPTLLERARAAGKSVGVVTSTRLTHATPACFFAHVPDREQEEEIARQLVDEANLDVAFGGGRLFFLPGTVVDGESGEPGRRKADGRNLIEEAKNNGVRIALRQSEFDALRAEVDSGELDAPVLGLFNAGHMEYEAGRLADPWGEPSLAEMTRLAIDILSRNPRGYFLMVEGGRIDHACHTNQARLALEDLLAFDDAIAEGLREAQNPDGPLVVVTADHETGGLALNGYRGLETSGEALLTSGSEAGADILTFATGPGARRPAETGSHRADLGYRQAALNYQDSSAHTGVDVGLWAAGPGAEHFEGLLDNTDVGRLLGRRVDFE